MFRILLSQKVIIRTKFYSIHNLIILASDKILVLKYEVDQYQDE